MILLDFSDFSKVCEECSIESAGAAAQNRAAKAEIVQNFMTVLWQNGLAVDSNAGKSERRGGWLTVYRIMKNIFRCVFQ
jgi:hypothetical protein